MAKWTIDPEHTVAHFEARHLMVTDVHGLIPRITGVIRFDAANVADLSSEVEIDVRNLWTGIEKRDNHLRSADFFDVQRHPVVRFMGTRAEVAGANMMKVHGELTIRGVTRPVVLDAMYFGPIMYQDETGSYTTMGFRATTEVNREDFGMAWNNIFAAGSFMVGKHIRVIVDGEADLSPD
ncbi:MAG: YceI family protein [Chloroflexi bacterium]|nr:YceI family protein [Chloroflexota bacterium]